MASLDSSLQSEMGSANPQGLPLPASGTAFLALQPRPGNVLTRTETQSLADFYHQVSPDEGLPVPVWKIAVTGSQADASSSEKTSKAQAQADRHLRDPKMVIEWNFTYANSLHVARYLFEVERNERLYERFCWWLLRDDKLPAIYPPLILLMMSYTHEPPAQWLSMAYKAYYEWRDIICPGRRQRQDEGCEHIHQALVDRQNELQNNGIFNNSRERWQVRLEKLYTQHKSSAKEAGKEQMAAQKSSIYDSKRKLQRELPHFHFISPTESLVCTGKLTIQWHPDGGVRVMQKCGDRREWTLRVPKSDMHCHEIVNQTAPPQDRSSTGAGLSTHNATAPSDQAGTDRETLGEDVHTPQNPNFSIATGSEENVKAPQSQSAPANLATTTPALLIQKQSGLTILVNQDKQAKANSAETEEVDNASPTSPEVKDMASMADVSSMEL